jgi:polar amino acid transport system substrate-binding protein
MKKLAVSLLALFCICAVATPSWAEPILEKVAKTGVLKAGTRKDAVPFAYVDQNGDWVGYSLDLLSQIKAQLEQELGKQIQLELVEVDVNNRIDKVVQGEVDIVCDTTTFTWEREKLVDFSFPYFLSGTQLLVKKDSKLASAESLQNKRIGVIPNSTNDLKMKQVQPQASYVPINNLTEGFAALQTGQIDALASDGILLQGLKNTAQDKNNWLVVPDESYDRQPYACMVPQENSQFRDLVNYSLVKFMQGVLVGDRNSIAILDHWFGPGGVMPRNQESMIFYFLNLIDYTAPIPDYSLLK